MAPITPAVRRAGRTPFFIAVYCPTEYGLIANGFCAVVIEVLSCSCTNVDLWAASQFWSTTAPLRILLLKNEYVPGPTWGANLMIAPGVPPTFDQSPAYGAPVEGSQV